MNKFVKIITTVALFFFSTQVALAAAGDISVKISQPKSPTNLNPFNVNFVALDAADPPRPVTVKCFKKGPTDASFSQFGSDFNLAAGGNSDNCVVDGSVLNSQGTYQFYVNAVAGADPAVNSTIVSVDYNTSGPGTPTDYAKEKIGSCTFKLKFKTANDGGKTVKVEFYRSDSVSFQANSGTIFATQSLGSNTNGEISNTIPDCAKTYYYALRAFDSAGNGSGLVGDTFTTTTSSGSTTTVVSPTSAPVIVAESQVTAPGEATVTPGTEASEKTTEINLTATPTPQVEGASTSSWWTSRKFQFFALVLVGLLTLYVLKRQSARD